MVIFIKVHIKSEGMILSITRMMKRTPMSNTIYELAKTVFMAETVESQKLQHNILKTEIQKNLSIQNDIDLNEAIILAQQDGKISIMNLIETLIRDNINTQHIYDNSQKYRSDFFILPFDILSEIEHTSLKAIQEIEQTWEKRLKEKNLISPGSSLYFAPIIIGYNTSRQMSASKWFELHEQILENREKRHLRQIFSAPFAIGTPDMKPVLTFYAGIVLQPYFSDRSPEPDLFKSDYSFRSDLEKLTTHYNETHNENNSKAVFSFYEPGYIFETLPVAYDRHQDMVLELFVDSYQTEEIHFALLSLDLPESFVLIAWNQKTNLIVNYMIIEPFTKDFQDSVDDVMSYLDTSGKRVYVGSNIFASADLEHYKTIDFHKYLKENTASILEDVEDLN